MEHSAADKMRSVGEKIATEVIPGVGFILIVFQHGETGKANYVSNFADKEEIEAAMEEVLEKIKKSKP